MRNQFFLSFLVTGILTTACGDDSSSKPDGGVAVDAMVTVPAFPENYRATYTEVRNCRKSGDHDLNNVRIWADPSALSVYQNRTGDFPDGAVVIKEEFPFDDNTCESAITQWTVMKKNSAATDRLGWDWETVDADRVVKDKNKASCIGCHTGCTGAPEVGYDYTCAEP